MILTVDVEDHGPADRPPRFREAMAPLLAALDRAGATATFFVVGELASRCPEVVAALSDAGHEVGLHGHSHRFLRVLGPIGLRDEVRRGRETLAEITGSAPVGFRAPYFSLTRDTPWAPEILREEGFAYSSSVLPAWNPQAGFPGLPKRPFQWSCGLVEFPVPVVGVGRWALPAIGGAYLRLLPSIIVRSSVRALSGRTSPWVYAHPYDFDVEEEFFVREHQRWIVAKLLFARRRLMLPRVLTLMEGGGTLAAAVPHASERSQLPSVPSPW